MGAAVLQHLAKNGGFIGPAGQEDHACCRVENRESEGDAVGLELFHPVGDNQAMAFVQRGALGKKGSGVPVGSEAQEDQIKAGELAR